MGDGEAADADRRAAFGVSPRDANDWVARGVAQLSEAPEAALADFNSALRVRPDHAAAINNAAHVYAECLDQPKQAIELLTRLVVLRPSAASAVASRGILRARLGETEAALSDAQTAAHLSPTGLEQLQIAGIHAMVSTPLDDNVNREEAIAWLARALRSDSSLAKTASTDSDLASLREDVRFRRLIGSAMALESAAR
jgi:tetratricopeptide (TPR) repeat protein